MPPHHPPTQAEAEAIRAAIEARLASAEWMTTQGEVEAARRRAGE